MGSELHVDEVSAAAAGHMGSELHADEDELSAMDARKAMNDQMQQRKHKRVVSPPHIDDSRSNGWDKEYAKVVHEAMSGHDAYLKREEIEELESRSMCKSEVLVTLTLMLLDKRGEATQAFLVHVSAAIRLSELREVVQWRCGRRLSARFRLLWLTELGETIVLDNTTFRHFALSNWCRAWCIHVHDEKLGPVEAIPLTKTATALFERYDVGGSGRINKSELLRLFKDLSLESLGCSDSVLEGFIHGEFARLDLDGSADLSLDEFTRYVTSMTRWMREELTAESDAHALFHNLASRATEVRMAPVDVPPTLDDTDTSDVYFENGRWVVDVQRFGVRVEIPTGALLPGARLAVQTVAPSTIGYLETGSASGTAEFAFTPAVRVDYPAFEKGLVMPELGGPRAPPFCEPLTLVMPHCFDPDEGEESCVFLGAQHGATQWDAVHAASDAMSLVRDDLVLDERELRATIPYAGVFCAYSSPQVEDVAAVRLHIYTLAELPRDDPSSLRVHLCPELPDQMEEMDLVEAAEWGAAQRVGSSKVLHLYQGTKLRVRYDDDRTGAKQAAELTWVGVRTACEFTLPVCGDKGEEPKEDDLDEREILRDEIAVDVLEGVGQRASRMRVVAKRAGIPEKGYEVPFATRLKSEVRPNAPALALLERAAHEFTVVWKKPVALDGDGDGDVAEITHYALELSTCAASGVYYPWRELWSGAGHPFIDFRARVNEQMAAKTNDKNAIRIAETHCAMRRTRLDEALAEAEAEAEAEAGAEGGGKAAKKRKRAKKRKAPAEAAAKAAKAAGDGAKDGEATAEGGGAQGGAEDGASDAPVIYGYSLEIEPTLFGRLRMRCWSEEESRPSRYSNVVKLPRFGAKADANAKDVEQRLVENARKAHFEALVQHVTEGRTVGHRIGNQPSRNRWGGDAMPPPPPSDRETAFGVMAPVPYDVPRLPATGVAGLAEAGGALAAFFREMGVEGGGGGLLFGLRIDHVLQAILGTPTADGGYSPRRTRATLAQPLIALIEVAYHDVLLPLLDGVLVVKSEWQYVDEKVYGLVARVATHVAHYDFIRPHLREILRVLHELYELMRQCQQEQLISFHLTHPDYSRDVKRTLRHELTSSLCSQLWKLSTEPMIFDASRARFAGAGGANGHLIYERQPAYEITPALSMRTQMAHATHRARELHLRSGLVTSAPLEGLADGAEHGAAGAVAGSVADGANGDVEGGAVGGADAHSLAALAWEHPATLQRELLALLRRVNLAPLDLVRAYERRGDGTLSEVDFVQMIKSITRPAEDSALAVWTARIKPAAVRAFRELRRPDELVDIAALVRWLNAGWQRQLLSSHPKLLTGGTGGGHRPASAHGPRAHRPLPLHMQTMRPSSSQSLMRPAQPAAPSEPLDRSASGLLGTKRVVLPMERYWRAQEARALAKGRAAPTARLRVQTYVHASNTASCWQAMHGIQ